MLFPEVDYLAKLLLPLLQGNSHFLLLPATARLWWNLKSKAWRRQYFKRLFQAMLNTFLSDDCIF